MEIICRITRAQLVVEFRHAMQDPSFEFGHVGWRNAFVFRESRKIAKQEAHRVSEASIAVSDTFQDFRADALVTRVVRLRNPEAQDVGSVLLDDRVRHDRVAERLGHLVASLVQREAMGQHAAIGRPALRAAALQQGRVEPASMLVSAFEV